MRNFMHTLVFGAWVSILVIATAYFCGGCRDLPKTSRPSDVSRITPFDGKEKAHIPLKGARSITFDGTKAFVCQNFSGLSVLDISSPETPKLVRHYPPEILQPLHAEIMPEHVLVAADRFRGLALFDVSQPDNPTTLSVLATPGIATRVHLFRSQEKPYVGVACGGAGFIVADMSDVTSPTIVGQFSLGTDYVSDMYVTKSLAFIANNNDGGLELFDLSSPRIPRPLMRVSLRGYCVSLDVQYPLLAVAYRTGGAALLKIERDARSSTPSLTLLSRVSTFPDYVHHVRFIPPRWLAAANNARGVQFYDISDPRTPVFVNSWEGEGEAVFVGIHEGYLYVCAWDGGVSIIKL